MLTKARTGDLHMVSASLREEDTTCPLTDSATYTEQAMELFMNWKTHSRTAFLCAACALGMLILCRTAADAYQHLRASIDKTRGRIAIGEIPPIELAAYAAKVKKIRVALVAREGESVAESLGD
jgi:hypothetical protein